MQSDYIPTAKDLQRFWKRVQKSPKSGGCWVWTAKLWLGYGRIKLDGHHVSAHRLSWVLAHGPIPNGLIVGHVCRNHACVNPEHLYLYSESEYFWSKVDKSGGPDACWEWTAGRSHGYGKIRWRGKPVLGHRIAWELTNGLVPENLRVLHRCDNPPCCNPAHLFLGTPADNTHDCASKGRLVVPRCYQLTMEQIAEIRQRYEDDGISQAAIARQFGIDPSWVSRIVNRRCRTSY